MKLETIKMIDDIVSSFKAAISKAVSPIADKVDTMEKSIAHLVEQISSIKLQKGEPGKDGTDGKNGTDGRDGEDGKEGKGIDSMSGDSGSLLIQMTDGSITTIPLPVAKDGADGKDGVYVATIQQDAYTGFSVILSDGTKHAINLPEPVAGKDGKDGEDGARGVGIHDIDINEAGELVYSLDNAKDIGIILGRVVGNAGKDGVDGTNGKDGEKGKDGRDGVGVADLAFDPAHNVLTIKLSDGRDFEFRDFVGRDGENGKDGANGVDGKDGEKGLDGKDGADVVSLLIDRAGSLVATLSNGAVKDLGVVVGKDGADGKDGENGADGQDGLGFDDMQIEHDGERGFSFKLTRGDVTKTFDFSVPVAIYRGVYKQGQTYERGDMVTFGGSIWHANEATDAKPETSKAWQLSVKRGDQGKKGEDGKAGLPGKEGRPGRDLTAKVFE